MCAYSSDPNQSRFISFLHSQYCIFLYFHFMLVYFEIRAYWDAYVCMCVCMCARINVFVLQFVRLGFVNRAACACISSRLFFVLFCSATRNSAYLTKHIEYCQFSGKKAVWMDLFNFNPVIEIEKRDWQTYKVDRNSNCT